MHAPGHTHLGTHITGEEDESTRDAYRVSDFDNVGRDIVLKNFDSLRERDASRQQLNKVTRLCGEITATV